MISLSQIGQVTLVAEDVERATAFYRDTLGITHLFTAPPGLAFFDCGGVRLMLSRPEGSHTSTAGSVIYFKVHDIEGTHRTLVGRGVAFTDPPHLIARMPDHELWMAFFRDTEGNVLALMEEKR